MSSYFSSLTSSSALSNIGTRLNSLRRAITSGDEADDPENEDCSHISNVLRAYYTEKGRPLPPWLPADPKAPTPAQPRLVATTQSQQYAQGGGVSPTSSSFSGRSGGAGGGLGDLWGDQAAGPSPPPSQTGSLRRLRGGAGGTGAGLTVPGGGAGGAHLTQTRSAPSAPYGQTSASPSPPPPQSSLQSLSPSASPGYSPSGVGAGSVGGGARPLPSQRVGSYQTAVQNRLGLERTASSSAQERLRARFQTGGGRSPSPNTAVAGRAVQGTTPPGSTYGSSAYGGGSESSSRRPVGLPSGPRPQR